MVREAVASLGGKASYKQIIDFIKSKHGEINEGTIRDQIIFCTVNQPSRIHYPQNSKPRKSDGQYDFLYSTGRGEVIHYNPSVHGKWEIVMEKGKPKIAKDGNPLADNPEIE